MLCKLWIVIYNANVTELLNANLASSFCKSEMSLDGAKGNVFAPQKTLKPSSERYENSAY